MGIEFESGGVMCGRRVLREVHFCNWVLEFEIDADCLGGDVGDCEVCRWLCYNVVLSKCLIGSHL